jgi:hypothetical protein
MDADLQHDERLLPKMVEALDGGLVTGIGSSEGDRQVTMSHGSAFVSPPSLSGRNHCDISR